MPLPYQSPKNPLRPIPSDRIPKPFTHDNPYARLTLAHFVRQQIKQFRWNTPTMTLDQLNIAAWP
jgi:hypothetical protein